MKEIIAFGSSNRKVAVYKGLKVAVYTVGKTEISLTRHDLIDLINVRKLALVYHLSSAPARIYRVRQKVPPKMFANISLTNKNFKRKFYTPILCSYLCKITKFLFTYL